MRRRASLRGVGGGLNDGVVLGTYRFFIMMLVVLVWRTPPASRSAKRKFTRAQNAGEKNGQRVKKLAAMEVVRMGAC